MLTNCCDLGLGPDCSSQRRQLRPAAEHLELVAKIFGKHSQKLQVKYFKRTAEQREKSWASQGQAIKIQATLFLENSDFYEA